MLCESVCDGCACGMYKCVWCVCDDDVHVLKMKSAMCDVMCVAVYVLEMCCETYV